MLPELCSYSSSTKFPFIHQDTSGCGRPEIKQQISLGMIINISDTELWRWWSQSKQFYLPLDQSGSYSRSIEGVPCTLEHHVRSKMKIDLFRPRSPTGTISWESLDESRNQDFLLEVFSNIRKVFSRWKLCFKRLQGSRVFFNQKIQKFIRHFVLFCWKSEKIRSE